MRRRTGKQFPRLVWASFVMLVLVWASAACGGEEDDAQPADPAEPTAAAIRVVATSNIVVDWARIVGGPHVEVINLMPVDADPHTFQPGPQDAAKIARADVVLAIGLEMEGFWLEDLLKNVARDPSIVLALGDFVEPVESMPSGADIGQDDHEEDEHADEDDHEHDDEDEEGHDDDEDEHADEDEEGHDEDEDEHADEDEDEHAAEDGHGHVHGQFNPHFWFDPIRVMSAINAMADRFAELDPAHADVYRANAAAYNAELQALHEWTLQQISAVAPERRLLLNSHDSYRYFAERYEFEIVGVILAVTTDVEPSAEHLASLVEVIKERNVPAVFGETTTSERLAQALADETGAKLVRLYSDSLGAEGSGAETYIGMVRANVELVVEALR